MTEVYCYAEKVPSSSDIFTDFYIKNAILYVPSSALELYKATSPWMHFGTIVALEGEQEETKQCATPKIHYSKGRLSFTSDTPNASFNSEIKDNDIKKYNGSSVDLSVTYTITVYAMADGYKNSDVATATLCWIDVDPSETGITDDTSSVKSISSQPVLIQSENGKITFAVAIDDEPVSVYNTSGILLGHVIIKNGTATIDTSLENGEIAIIKIGNKSLKVVVH